MSNDHRRLGAPRPVFGSYTLVHGSTSPPLISPSHSTLTTALGHDQGGMHGSAISQSAEMKRDEAKLLQKINSEADRMIEDSIVNEMARIEATPHPPSKGGSASPSIVKRQAGGEKTKLSLKSKHKTSSSPTHRRTVVEKEVPNPYDSIAVRSVSSPQGLSKTHVFFPRQGDGADTPMSSEGHDPTSNTNSKHSNNNKEVSVSEDGSNSSRRAPSRGGGGSASGPAIISVELGRADHPVNNSVSREGMQSAGKAIVGGTHAPATSEKRIQNVSIQLDIPQATMTTQKNQKKVPEKDRNEVAVERPLHRHECEVPVDNVLPASFHHSTLHESADPANLLHPKPSQTPFRITSVVSGREQEAKKSYHVLTAEEKIIFAKDVRSILQVAHTEYTRARENPSMSNFNRLQTNPLQRVRATKPRK